MKFFKIFLCTILVILISIFLIVYNFYPKTGYFNDLILLKYSQVKFEKAILTNTQNVSDSFSTNDINKINNILSYLGKLELTEFKNETNEDFTYNEYHDIGLYGSNATNSYILGISVYNEKLIQIYIGIDGKTKMYKLTNDKLDINHIKKLIQE